MGEKCWLRGRFHGYDDDGDLLVKVGGLVVTVRHDTAVLDAPRDLHLELKKARDEARREAERLRKLVDRLEDPDAKIVNPAPQTHFRPGDVVFSPPFQTEHRLASLSATGPTRELWNIENDSRKVLIPGKDIIISRCDSQGRDVPTDEGLRRLAKMAGLGLLLSDVMDGRVEWGEDTVWLSEKATDDDRRALAAALREMGGA